MTEQVYKTIKIEKEDGIAWLIMNRPKKRNAMNPKCTMKWTARCLTSRRIPK